MSPVIVTTTRSPREIEKTVDLAVLELMAEKGPTLLNIIKANTPTSTGELKDSLKLTAVSVYGKNRYSVSIRTDSPKINYFLDGVRPHNIPSTGGALAFMFPAAQTNPRSYDGRQLYKRVDHPGIQKNNFIREAVRNYLPLITGLDAKKFITRIRI